MRKRGKIKHTLIFKSKTKKKENLYPKEMNIYIENQKKNPLKNQQKKIQKKKRNRKWKQEMKRKTKTNAD